MSLCLPRQVLDVRSFIIIIIIVIMIIIMGEGKEILD